MTLLERVRNVLGFGPQNKRRRWWWWMAVLVLLVLAAIGLTWAAMTYGKYTVSAFILLDIQEPSVLTGQTTAMDLDRFKDFQEYAKGKTGKPLCPLSSVAQAGSGQAPRGSASTTGRRCGRLAQKPPVRQFSGKRGVHGVKLPRL